MSISSERMSEDLDVRVEEERSIDLRTPLERRRDVTLALSHARACDPAITGAKGAALALAATKGLPVLPGFVITTDACAHIVEAGGVLHAKEETLAALRSAWDVMSFGGTRSLVVRSSSTGEDGAESSMAGRFTSVLDVTTWDDFLISVEEVLASAGEAVDAPMAVLVQPQMTAARGGIMFGVDPVTGRKDRLLVSAIAGGPDQLVGGAMDGSQYALSHWGRLLNRKELGGDHLLHLRQRRALAKLAYRARVTFGGPQDIEWAMDDDEHLWLFQSRPVTATAGEVTGPIFGPGPVAETFPDALAPLEEDLWVPPLRTAIKEALKLTGSAAKKRLAESPIVVTVAGQVAADLELLGAVPGKKSFFAKIDPRPPARRLAASWRVGRLQAALPTLALDIAGRVDDELANVPNLRTLTGTDLLDLIDRSRQTLVSLHGHEVLAGLVDTKGDSTTGSAIALAALIRGRSIDMDDDMIRGTRPEVLALTSPRIGPPSPLPSTSGLEPTTLPVALDHLGPREALRMRVRWIQELTSLACLELGWRLACAGLVTDAEEVRKLSLVELAAMTEANDIPDDLHVRPIVESPPLPSLFRFTSEGEVVAHVAPSSGRGEGRGAGGGRAMGPVSHGESPARGDVLVVRVLDPRLAPLLPHLGGLVAETGSVLSHLAILAREYGVPTVVGVPGATERFAPGTVVVVDGTTGEVSEMDQR
jgi:pyruvate,water dikinase